MDCIRELYKEYIGLNADPRVQNLPLMGSPKVVIYCVILYVIFVKIVGPLYMKNKEPFDLKKWVIIYNGFQTIFSLTMVLMAIYIGWKIKFSFICQNTNQTKIDPDTLQSINLAWIFFISRFFKFIETIFFVLRKENNHISLLHVVHHASVPLICWLGMKVEPTGQYVLAGGINTFVHTFMYFYYMIEAMGPEYKHYLRWTKYVAILHLAQFALIFSHIYTILSDCPVNKFIAYLLLFQTGLFFNLSFGFCKESYGYAGSNLDSLVNFDYEKFFNKYKKFFEMCIPDQNALMADDVNENMNDKKEHDE